MDLGPPSREACQPDHDVNHTVFSLTVMCPCFSHAPAERSILGAKDREGLMQVKRDLLTLQRMDLNPFCQPLWLSVKTPSSSVGVGFLHWHSLVNRNHSLRIRRYRLRQSWDDDHRPTRGCQGPA